MARKQPNSLASLLRNLLFAGQQDGPGQDFAPDEDDEDDEDLEEYQLHGQPQHHGYLSPRAQATSGRLREELADPAKLDRRLASLSGEAALLLRLFAEIGTFLPLPFASEEARLLLGPALAGRAGDELQEQGLLISDPPQNLLGLPHEVCGLLLPRLPLLDQPQSLQGAAPQQPAALLRVPFELALLAVAILSVRPKCTQSGPLYKRDEERLQSLLGKQFPLGDRLFQLKEMRLCQGVDALTVPPQAMKQLAELTAPELCRMLATQVFSGPRRRVLSLLYSGVPGRSWFPRSALERAMRISYLQNRSYFYQHATLARSAADEVTQLLGFPGIQVATEKKRQFARLWPPMLDPGAALPEPAHPVRIHLQPSFELLVPPDVVPGALLELGGVAELQKVDQLATFSVNRTSVSRAVDQGMDADAIVQVLARHCFPGVPQNVEAQVRGWARLAGQARFAQGLVLVLKEDAERMALADAALQKLLGMQVGAGVYLVAEANRAAIEKRLKALDLQPSEGVARLREAEAETDGGLFRYRQPLPALPAVPGDSDPLWQRADAIRGQAHRDAETSGPGGKEAAPVLHLRKPGPAQKPPGPARPGKQASSPEAEARDDDPVPPQLTWASPPQRILEAMLRQATARHQTVYVQLQGGRGPWALVPQRISHRGRETYLEAYRSSTKEYRSIPLSACQRIAVR